MFSALSALKSMLFASLISTVSVCSFRRVGQRVGQARKTYAKTAPQ